MGVNVTVTNIREKENYWIPGLRQLRRQLRKKVISRCHGCKRFQSKPFTPPIPGYLPKTHNEQKLPLKFIGADYAGPIYCQMKSKREVKVYILLFTCSMSRAIQLKILTNQRTGKFIKALKRLVTKWGRPQIIYPDNTKMFTSAEKWINKINKDEQFKDYLAREEMTWKFNLAKALWWGGQFERMIELTKPMLYKSFGNTHLTMNWKRSHWILKLISTTDL